METKTITFMGPSALALIRAARIDRGMRLCTTDLKAVPEVGSWEPSATRLQRLLPMALASDLDHHPLYVCAPTPEGRARRQGLAWKVDRRPLPQGSILEVRGLGDRLASAHLPRDLRVLVTSPEETIAALAGMLCAADRHGGFSTCSYRTFVRMAGVSLELCGRYGRSPLAPSDGTCLYDLAPATSADALMRYAAHEDTGSGEGMRLLRSVVPYLADGLRSPLEAATYLSMRLIPRRGGLSFPPFRSNEPFPVPESLRAQGYQESITPDFWWPDQKVVVETEGFATHGTREGRARDNQRLRVYQACDITVFPALYNEVRTRQGMDALLALVADRLCERAGGAALRRRFRRTFEDERGRALREELLSVVLPPVRDPALLRAD